ncbi:ATP10 protein-domain-containing protein [Protomyces lactucae-debilis]|uniref:ATP10 protein-domain-containing protein n=1 Tax=Protomyces lactucae-debilis TaxID=2754530 RepID=A0A1Y2F4U7_PROLT|nr:ATP10 protein-domain-containing protein [Protomyces lactucae-debilis]ORY78948.1 ATP10 protein-domain-containing protein [Protomyces lactucae-debilis]
MNAPRIALRASERLTISSRSTLTAHVRENSSSTLQKPAAVSSDEGLPPSLDRPLGFPMPMQPLPPLPTLLQRTKTLLTTPGQHKKILAEEGGSYWRDFHAMRQAGGKQWTAPRLLFRQDKALYFPNVKGNLLSSGKEVELRVLLEEAQTAGSKAFLVRCFSATSGEEQVRGLGEALGVATIDLNMQTNAQQARYLIMDGGYASQLRYIGAVNAYVGYTYLLDLDGKIRWASSGALTETEQASLAKVASKLV